MTCGADAQERSVTQHCSGSSSDCDGATVEGDWSITGDCALEQACEADASSAVCLDCTYGCASGACNPPECDPGPCCDNGFLKVDTETCDTWMEYGCTDTICGADPQEREVTQYCSGLTGECDGAIVEGDWSITGDCDPDQECQADAVGAACLECDYGCETGTCVIPECTSGDCCDLDTWKFRGDSFECSTEDGHLCQNGICGGVLRPATVRTFCSGTSSDCDGRVERENQGGSIHNCEDYQRCDADKGDCFTCVGGCENDECQDCTWTWEAINNLGPSPNKTAHHAAMWVPEFEEMWVYGGVPTASNFMHRYDVAGDDWSVTSSSGGAEDYPEMVWTGTLALFGSGGYYRPSDDFWDSFPNDPDRPTVTMYLTAVWTATEMIVWGGGEVVTNYGARYDPVARDWVPTSQGANCPAARRYHTAVWTGTEMIIWGGGDTGTNTGGRYNPSTDTWQATSTGFDSPLNRTRHTAIWTGHEMIVFGGAWSSDIWNDGGRYDPVADSWASLESAGAPHRRGRHTATWTGAEMIVWGGHYIEGIDFVELESGGHFDPYQGSWRPTETVNAPSPRYHHSAVWTGREMIVWGGKHKDDSTDYYLDDGARYYCDPD